MSRNVPRILAISDRLLIVGGDPLSARLSAGHFSTWDAWLEELAADGVDTVQVREKDLGDRAGFELLRRTVTVGRALGLRILANGRADLALAAEADGVHLPTAEIPVARLRRRFGEGLVIGRSTHTPEEVGRAMREGADYVTFGPIWETPSKVGYGSPPGIEDLRRATGFGLPVLALGGVDAVGVAEVAAAGAAGVAAIRALAEPAPRRRLVTACRRQWSPENVR